MSALTATLATTPAVPSVLPEDGLDLIAELARYQQWMVDQAMARTLGNRAQAAKLLGLNRTTLVEMLRRMSASARARGPAMKQPETASEAQAPAEAPPAMNLAARIPWAVVAQMRADGKSEYQITRRLAQELGAHRFTIEKALKQPRPLARCGP